MKNDSTSARDSFFLRPLQSVRASNGTYYCLRFLGKGGNGTAFLVSCSEGRWRGTQAVLKVFHKISDSTRRQAFLEEVKHLSRLDHPAIIDVFDEGEYQAGSAIYPFAVIEYVPKTARELISSKSLDRLRAVRIALNCLSGLQAMHSATPPLIHRDIKPENILIGDAGAKLADLGLAKSAEPEAEDGSDFEAPKEVDDLEEAGTQLPGMPRRYRTPEQVARARGTTDARVVPESDIFQFGTVFYEMLTGYNPQNAPGLGKDSILDDIHLDFREIRGCIGGCLTGLIGDMLEFDPNKRPSAVQCISRLDLAHRELCEQYAAVAGTPF